MWQRTLTALRDMDAIMIRYNRDRLGSDSDAWWYRGYAVTGVVAFVGFFVIGVAAAMTPAAWKINSTVLLSSFWVVLFAASMFVSFKVEKAAPIREAMDRVMQLSADEFKRQLRAQFFYCAISAACGVFGIWLLVAHAF